MRHHGVRDVSGGYAGRNDLPDPESAKLGMRDPTHPYQGDDRGGLTNPIEEPPALQTTFQPARRIGRTRACHARHVRERQPQFVTDPQVRNNPHGIGRVVAEMSFHLDAPRHRELVCHIGLKIGLSNRINWMFHLILQRF
jgi:hypothetical protein